MIEPNVAYSRPLAAVRALGEDAGDPTRFLEGRVLLASEEGVIQTSNGRVMALTALRLLPRVFANVSVLTRNLPEALVNELKAEAARIAFGNEVTFVDNDTDPGIRFDAALSIGRCELPELRFIGNRTAIAANGWVVWVAANGAEITASTSVTNPIAAVAAACMGVTETFKQLLPLKPSRGQPADGQPFSILTYEVGANLGPTIPDNLSLNGLLVGFGAIGNGIIATLNELPVSGSLLIVDRQKFGVENLGTCMLAGVGDLGSAKAEVAVAAIQRGRGRIVAKPFVGDIEAVDEAISVRPHVVLAGLDSATARRATQLLWADVTFDGAIGDFMCQVGVHPGDPDIDVACLRCLFPEQTGANAKSLLAEALGVHTEQLGNLDDLVTDNHVRNAADEVQDLLRAYRGRPICSVPTAQLINSITEARDRANFRPSMPFVASMSGALVVGEWVKYAMGIPPGLEPVFQFDVLRGLSGGLDFGQRRRAECDCIVRQAAIKKFRSAMGER